MQFDVPGSQMTLDFLTGRPIGHIDFDENLLHGLVPGAPRRLAGDNAAALLEVHRHAAAPRRLTGRLAQS